MNTQASTGPAAFMIKLSAIAAGLASAMLLSGCNTLERSRSLADPAVPAIAIAQQVCSNCHGIDGNAESPNFPNLAAQQEAYFIAQLNGFKSHGRSDPAGFEYMWGLSKNLTDAQIAGLAAFYAKQTPRRGWQNASSSALHDEGKKLFNEGISASGVPPCGTCHAADAGGQAAFPRLAGQHADYLVKQLMVFQRTDERPEGSVMKGIAHSLTAQNMEAVAAYLASLPRG